MAVQISPRGSLEEDAPLLSPLESDSPLPIAQSAPQNKKQPWLGMVILIGLLIVVIDIGAFLMEPPKTRLFESNLCLRYYRERDPTKINPDGTVDEALCKVDQVQQDMAMIFGWQDMFDSIPGILLAVPYGALADKWGRKWVFASCLQGLQFGTAWILLICYFQNLSLQLTWFSSAFYIIGGGGIVAIAIGMTMVSDVCPPEKRTSIFVYLSATVLVSELIAPILAAHLMEYGNWLPLMLALAIQQLGILMVCFLPETLHRRPIEPKDDNDEQSIELQTKEQRGHGFKAQLRNFQDAFTFLKSDFMLALVMLSFLGNRLGRQSLTMLIRYASARYHWKIKDASYLVSFRAGTNLVALLVFIPAASVILMKYLHLPAPQADLWLARGSIVITTISMLLLGIAAHHYLLIFGLLIYNLGTGYAAAMRSTAVHVVGGQSSPEIGRMMSVIAIIESVGTMIAGPTLNKALEVGIDLGEPWVGLPYLGCGVVYGCVAVVTFLISVKGHEPKYFEVESDEPLDTDSPRTSSSTLERQATHRHSTNETDDAVATSRQDLV